jgi:hypothetical protein
MPYSACSLRQQVVNTLRIWSQLSTQEICEQRVQAIPVIAKAQKRFRARYVLRTMNTSNMVTGVEAPYPSSRPGTPSRIEAPEYFSSVHSMESRPVLSSPLFSATTRPSTYAEQSSWENSYGDSIIGSRHYPEIDTEDALYPYSMFVSDMQSTQQHSISMPDHNDYVGPIMARGRGEDSFLKSPPYPLHGHEDDEQSTNSLQLYHDSSIRQPTAEDFLRPDHPLPVPPPKVYDSDQDLPVIEPDSYLPEGFDSTNFEPQSQQQVAAAPKRHHTNAVAIAPSKPKPRQDYKRSHSELIVPSHEPALVQEPAVPEHYSAPVRVPTINSDMYQPALGGLQRLSGVQRKDSKRNRVKRFMSSLNPFRHERKFGRQQR